MKLLIWFDELGKPASFEVDLNGLFACSVGCGLAFFILAEFVFGRPQVES